MALTTKQVAKLTEPGRYGDGGGLYLQVTPTGARSWLLRYERGGRERAMGWDRSKISRWTRPASAPARRGSC